LEARRWESGQAGRIGFDAGHLDAGRRAGVDFDPGRAVGIDLDAHRHDGDGLRAGRGALVDFDAGCLEA
jgi:hypothetical protein